MKKNKLNKLHEISNTKHTYEITDEMVDNFYKSVEQILWY